MVEDSGGGQGLSWAVKPGGGGRGREVKVKEAVPVLN
jgi:hypothetical protein